MADSGRPINIFAAWGTEIQDATLTFLPFLFFFPSFSLCQALVNLSCKLGGHDLIDTISPRLSRSSGSRSCRETKREQTFGEKPRRTDISPTTQRPLLSPGRNLVKADWQPPCCGLFSLSVTGTCRQQREKKKKLPRRVWEGWPSSLPSFLSRINHPSFSSPYFFLSLSFFTDWVPVSLFRVLIDCVVRDGDDGDGRDDDNDYYDDDELLRLGFNGKYNYQHQLEKGKKVQYAGALAGLRDGTEM